MTLYRIANCETGGALDGGADIHSFNASVIGALGEVSIFQIHPIHFYRFDRSLLQSDVGYAARAALTLGLEAGFSFHWRTCGS